MKEEKLKNVEAVHTHTGNLKNKKGITLVALVVTIIILLILTGISIASLTGNGLFEKAELAKEKHENAQVEEDTTLADYENKIIEATYRDNGILNDLNVNTSLEESIDISIKIDVQEKYEDAMYIYILNNKIVKCIPENSVIIENLDAQTDYKVIVIIVEGSGDVHRGTSQIRTRKENVDVYAKVADIQKLGEYGISYTYSGYAQTLYNKLYELGMGSGSGVHYNTYTLTIDYDTLTSKIEENNFSGVYGQFWQYGGSTSNSYTAWVYSKIIVKYDDNTTSEISTETTSAKNINKSEEPFAMVTFDKDKKVSQIQMIIYEYDCDYGSAYGAIKNIGLIR